MKKNTPHALALAALLLALLPGCSTNSQGDDAAPVFLTGEFTQRILVKQLLDATPMQFQTTTLRNNVKVPSAGVSTFLDVNVDSVQVRWTRLDGGTVASKTEPFGVGVIVPAGGSSSLTNYQYMSTDALLRPPLDQLYPFNGGIDRETGKAEIRQMGHARWFGHTLSGQAVVSDETSFDIVFVYGAAAGRIEAKRVR